MRRSRVRADATRQTLANQKFEQQSKKYLRQLRYDALIDRPTNAKK
jgi:hypothetical protein